MILSINFLFTLWDRICNPTASVDIPLDSATEESAAEDMKLGGKKRLPHEVVYILILDFLITISEHPSEVFSFQLKLQYVAFTTLLGLCFGILWNVIAVTTAWIKLGGLGDRFIALIYCSTYRLLIRLIQPHLGILPAIDLMGDHVLVGQVYMYFRGSGKAAEMKRDAARGALRAAI
ncbi:hypothetical protein SASPL_157875 [Salvia splendens]|uniref:Uncharacterized protein n=1 Tax=Salvia splendens TaxID=180675 RepID=A0A8X8VU85_SALSN|nr:hypothetical protein SASPL_157875 [Salvia splendens]